MVPSRLLWFTWYDSAGVPRGKSRNLANEASGVIDLRLFRALSHHVFSIRKFLILQ